MSRIRQDVQIQWSTAALLVLISGAIAGCPSDESKPCADGG
ncbi:uncharacterized protein METZ01_LOCUS302457, partial [marine metagenome]